MRNKFAYLAGLAFLTAVHAAQSAATPPPAAAQAAPPLVFLNYGFRINPLDAGTDRPVIPAVQMYLPSLPLPSDNRLTFAPNVYVQVVPYMGTMKQYIAESTKQMLDGGYIIRGQISPTPDEWDVEYIAVLNGLAMHWYAKATYANFRVYYAAGGSPDEMWALSVTSDGKSLGDKLKECVNSLTITGTAPELKVVPLQQTPVPAPIPAAGSAPVAAPAPAKATGAAPASSAATAKK